MTQSIEFQKTADGLRAAAIGHLVMAIAPTPNGFRNLFYAGPRDIEDLIESDFMRDGDIDQPEETCIQRIETEAKDQVQKALLGRRRLTDEELKQLPNTEWGKADGGTYYAPGVVSVFTPSHGGLIISQDVHETLPEAAQTKLRSRIGNVPGQADTLSDVAFYEEDISWALLALGMPEIFTDREKDVAERVLIDDFPNEWEAVRGEVIPEGKSRTREQERFRKENAKNLVTISAITDNENPGKVRVTAAVGGRQTNGRHGKTREFLVDEPRYMAGFTNGGYVIDESVDIELDKDGQPLSLSQAA